MHLTYLYTYYDNYSDIRIVLWHTIVAQLWVKGHIRWPLKHCIEKQICICFSDFLLLCYDNYCFFSLALLHTAEVPHLISLTTLELGGNATFHCPFSEKTDRFFHWYKQSLGKMVQTVATVVYKKIELISPFNHTRFHVHKSNDQCFLTINHINKEDEATYFCQTGSEFLQHFVRGFFLAVNGKICYIMIGVYWWFFFLSIITNLFHLANNWAQSFLYKLYF